jgi:hypothetical protein
MEHQSKLAARALAAGDDVAFVATRQIRTDNLVLEPGMAFPAAWSTKDCLERFARTFLRRADASWRDIATLAVVARAARVGGAV